MLASAIHTELATGWPSTDCPHISLTSLWSTDSPFDYVWVNGIKIVVVQQINGKRLDNPLI